MKQSLQQNVQILWLPYTCKFKDNLHWRKYLKLRNFRFLCSSRSHKRSKFNSKCGPTFCPPCAWRSGWKPGYFQSFFCRRPNYILNDKKLSQFDHNVWKYKLVNAVLADFNNTIIWDKWTKRLRKKQPGGNINSIGMCPCPENILDFWYYRRNVKDGWDNFMFAKFHDLMAIFAVCHILRHYWKKYFYFLIMLKQKQTC